ASAAMRVRSAASARWTGTVQPAITLWLAARSVPSRDRYVDGLERLRRVGETFDLGLELAETGLERSALDRGGFELALEVRHLGFPGGHQRTDTLELLGEGRLLRIALIQRGLDLGQHRRLLLIQSATLGELREHLVSLRGHRLRFGHGLVRDPCSFLGPGLRSRARRPLALDLGLGTRQRRPHLL